MSFLTKHTIKYNYFLSALLFIILGKKQFLSRLAFFIFLSLFSSQIFAAIPVVSNGIQSEQLPGKSVCFNADFSNTGSPGYAPYIRLILPPELSFSSASIPSLGLSVGVTDVGVFAASTNELIDSLSLNSINTVNGPQDSHLYLLNLPIGSVVAGGPPIVVEICSTLLTSADIDVPVNVSTQGVYRFGDTPTATAEDTIEGPVDTQLLTPVLAILQKNSTAPENERVPGSSFPFDYRLNVEIAQSKIVNDLFLTDTPDFSALTITTPATITGSNCVVDDDINNGMPLSVHCDPITGTASTSDVTARFSSYVNDVLNPNSCSGQPVINNAQATGLHLGVAFNDSKTHTLTAKHAAIQSSSASTIVNTGDIATFTSNMQFNGFNSVDSIVIEERLSDGLSLESGTAKLSIGGGPALPIAPTSIVPNPDNSTSVFFEVSGSLLNTVAALTYDVQVNNLYNTGLAVLAGDTLDHTTTLSYALNGGASGCSDTSSGTLTIISINTEKSIINPKPEYHPGDDIEFLLKINIPSGYVKDIIITDFLPLPVIDATGIDNTLSIAANASFSFDASDTHGADPDSITLDAATNSVRIEWHNIQPQSLIPSTALALRLTVPIKNIPFSDGLKLTNLVSYQVSSTDGSIIKEDKAAVFVARAPLLKINKGIASTDNPSGVYTPPVSTPVDSDLSEVEAGNRVDYVITIENIGGHAAANVFISDVTPAGLINCSVDTVLDGQGTALAVSPAANDLFTTGITIDHHSVDIIGTQASLAANDGSIGAPYGRDTAIVSYHCELDSSVYPQQIIENTALTHWTNVGGADFYPDQEDKATITIKTVNLNKTISQVIPLSDTTGDPGTVTVGDIIEYSIPVTLPAGTTQELTLLDTLPDGYIYQTGTLNPIFDSSSITLGATPTASVIGNDLTIYIAGSTTVFNDAIPANNIIDFRFKVLVADTTQNDAASHQQLKRNVVTLDYTNKPAGSISASHDNHFVEPVAHITKTILPHNLEGGDIASVRLQVTNTGTSPLYDVVVTDILNQFGNVVDLGQPVTSTLAPANFNFNYINPTVSYSMTSGSLLPGQSVTFEFEVTIEAGAVSGTKFKNEGTVQGQSQPASAGSSIRRPSNDIDDATFNISKLGLSKRLISSSESFTQDKDKEVAIGEILTYRLTFLVPKSTLTLSSTTKPFISDILPEGYRYIDGSAIAYANNPGIFYSEDPLDSTPAPSWPEIPTTAIVADPSPFFTVSNNNRNLSFAFGNMDNQSVASGKDKLIIEYQVQVLNHASNNRGDDKTNRVRVNYLNGFGQEQHINRSLTTIIAESNLSITKVASPKSVVAGQLVNYVLTFANNSATHASYAWEPEIVDFMLKNKFSLPVLNSAVMSRGGQDLSACINIDSTVLYYEIDLDMSRCLPANERFLAPGESIIIHYGATAAHDALFEDELKNTVIGRATSLPGDFGTGGSGILAIPGAERGERNGSQPSGVNDLIVAAQESVFVNKPVLTKASDADLQIGDVHTQTLTISVPPGSTSQFMVTDILPTGLFFGAQVVNISLPAGLNITGSPQTNWPSASTTLIFDFGTILNSLSTASDIVITYQVRVDNILANQQGQQLLNTASLSYTGAISPSSDTSTVKVIEPDISLEKKITAGATGSVAGDLITYQVILKNNSIDATAYQLNLVDIMPADLTGNLPDSFDIIFLDNPGDKVINTVTGLPLVAGDAIIPSIDTLTWPELTVLPKGSLTIDYQVRVVAGAVAGDILTNTVTADYNSQASGPNGRDGSDGFTGLNDYFEQKSVTLVLDASIAIAKQLDAAHPSDKFTIGDEVFYDVVVHLQEGTSNSVVVTDLLPVGIAFDSLLGIHAPNNISYDGPGVAVAVPAIPDPAATTLITIDLNTVINIADGDPTNDSLTVRLKAIVEDIPTNIQGQVLTNEANITAADVVGNVLTDGPVTVDIEIIEANLEIIKTASNPTPAIGGAFTYIIKVQHNNSLSDARDIVLTDIIPAGLNYVIGSTQGQASVDESNPDTPVFSMGDLTLVEGSKEFSFDVTVDHTVTANIAITNTMTGHYAGQNASHSPLPIREYNTSGAVDVTPIDADFIYTTKTVSLSGDVNGNGVNNPGDSMTYTVTLFNKHNASLNDVIFGDVISTLVDYVPGSLTTTQGTDTSPSATILQVLAGTLAGGDKVIITYQVVIKGTVPDGQIVYNQGKVDSLETATKLTDWDGNEANGYQATQFPVFIVYAPTPPDLYVQKFVAQLIDADHSSSNTPGDTMRYQFIINNDGLVDLSNVTIDDIIPDGLTYVPGSVISSSGSSANVGGNILSAVVSSLPAGAQEMFVFNVTIDSPLYDAGTDGDLDNEVFINQADVNAGGLPPGLSDGDGNKHNGNQSTQFTAGTSGGGGGGSSLLGPAIDKQGTHNGRWPDVDWTISIANQLNSVNLPIIISDSIPVDTTYTTGSISCSTPAGSLTVISSCLFDNINNRLYVIATLASDLGVGDMDLAQHKVIVEFKTRVNNASPTRIVTNTANGFWDRNNNGRVIDDIIAGQTPVVAAATVNAPAREIPTLSIPALILLCIMLILSTAYYRSGIKI